MTKFEVGKRYYCRSIADSDCIFEFEVVKRTEKTITIKNMMGEVKRRKVDVNDDVEFIYPLGKYSMCPTLRSNKEIAQDKEIAQYIVKEDTQKQDVVAEATEEKPIKYYEINEEMAARAKSMMSFNDYKKGSATEEYRNMVDNAYSIAEKQKNETDSMYHEKIDYYFDLYARKLANNFNKHYEIGTRCPSIMIVGAGNFPVKKKEKQVEAWNKNAQEYQEIQKLLDKIKGIGQGGISSDDPQAIEKLKAKLDTLEQNQAHMKAVNAYYRKHNTLEGCTLLSEHEFVELNTSMNRRNRTDKNPYESFCLSNNNVNIKRIKQRIEELEKRDSLKGWTFENGEIVVNKEINRLQILFDERPSEELRTKLKRNGFKWAPSQSAWQRQLTKNAIYTAKRIKELAEIQV